MEAQQAIQQATGMSEAEAKTVFERSPAWRVPRASAAPQAPGREEPATAGHGRSGHGASSVLTHLRKNGK